MFKKKRAVLGICVTGLACMGSLRGQERLEDPPVKLAPISETSKNSGAAKANGPSGGLAIPAFPVNQADPLDSYIKGLWAYKRAGLLEAIFQLEAALRADPPGGEAAGGPGRKFGQQGQQREQEGGAQAGAAEA